jgi:hypothetical protein
MCPAAAAGAGGADPAALVCGVAEGICLTGLELRDPVQALSRGVGDAGQDRADDLVFPAGYRPRQAEQFGGDTVRARLSSSGMSSFWAHQS